MKDAQKYNEKIAALLRRKAYKVARRSEFRFDEAEDIQQELALALWSRWPRYRPELSSPNTFVHRVANNKIADLIVRRRAKKRHVHLGGLELLEEYLAVTGDLEQDLRIDLGALLARLSSADQALCRQLATMTVSEVSRASGIPRSTLYEKIRALRRRFKEADLDEYL